MSSFEPVASCLLSLWSITELSSSVKAENTTSKANSKNCLSHISRKRSFSDAVEMASPLRNSPSVHHPSWIGSVKRRKIHQFATKWTSGLAPSSFVKIYTMLDFWQVMATRVGSELKFDTISKGTTTNDMDASDVCSDTAMESTPPPSPMSDRPRSILMEDDAHAIGEATSCRTGRTTLQFPHPGQILRGLWEEEQQNKRRKQMVPDNVRRQARSKTFKTPLDVRTRVLQLEPWRVTPTNQGRTKPVLCSNSLVDGQSGTDVDMAQGESSRLDDDARNRLGSVATTVQRFQAVSEGQALSEYQPWRDGTTIPSQGSLKTLHEIRQTVMDPWPEEISRAKDECTRILHRMREQLNIVINLQIHLRSLIKTAPTQLSFLLSIRHPGQVSIELLLALYGPHFMQTSNFRAIEQLLWGQNSGQPVQEQVFQ
ncbi:hypothetical protein CPB97_010756 [Podila verticillata]|nr:hypothetical protein CPB97_010756 [Podila verticillata]